MTSNIKKTFLNGRSRCISPLIMRRRLIKAGWALMLCNISHSHSADRNYISSVSETPVDYYQCISGACSQKSLKLIHLKSSVDLSMTPVKDQDPLGTCTSFAVGACVEYRTIHSRYDEEDEERDYYSPVSEAEFTVFAEQNTPGGDCKQGLNLGEALKVAKERGFINEKYWPYSEYVEKVRELNGLSEGDEIEDSAHICVTNKYTVNQLRKAKKYKLNDIKVISHIPRQSILTAVSTEIQRAPMSRNNLKSPLTIKSPHPDEDALILKIKAYLQRKKSPVAISVATFERWGNGANIAMPTLDIVKQWSEQHLQTGNAGLSSRSNTYYDFSDDSLNFSPNGWEYNDRHNSHASSSSFSTSNKGYDYNFSDTSLTFSPNGWEYNNRHNSYPSSSSFRSSDKRDNDEYISSPFSKLSLGQNLQSKAYKEGWHAVVITGYDDSKQAFKIKNSWGEGWGDEGYGWLPYDYVKLYTSELVATF